MPTYGGLGKRARVASVFGRRDGGCQTPGDHGETPDIHGFANDFWEGVMDGGASFTGREWPRIGISGGDA